MNILQFFYFLLMLLIIGSLVIIGFYIITRGTRHVQPDGTYKVSGKILSGWSLFWEQVVGTKQVYYRGVQLLEKYNTLCYNNADFCWKVSVTKERMSMEMNVPLADSELSIIQEVLQCRILIKEKYLFLYNDETEYYFPEWVRYPLSQCPPCMASVGGTIIYWPIVCMKADLFAWAYTPILAAIYFWFVFCVALACLNKFIHKIVGLY